MFLKQNTQHWSADCGLDIALHTMVTKNSLISSFWISFWEIKGHGYKSFLFHSHVSTKLNTQFQTVKKEQKRPICFKRYLLEDRREKEKKSQERNNPSPSSRQNAGEVAYFTIITVDVEYDGNLHSDYYCFCGTHAGLSGLFFCGKMQSGIGSLVCSETRHHKKLYILGLSSLEVSLTTAFLTAISIRRRQNSSNQFSRLLKVKKKKERKEVPSLMVFLFTLGAAMLLLVEIKH